MRRVMVATPAYDGKVCVQYVVALAQSIKLCMARDIDLCPVVVPGEAIIQRARNDLLQIAIDQKVDDSIWIDADIGWQPEWILRLLGYPVDVVGGTYPHKHATESYVCKGGTLKRDGETGLLEVIGLGLGFVRMSSQALQALYDVGRPYLDEKQPRRMAFEVTQDKDGRIASEDVIGFRRLAECGYQTYLDPFMTCQHVGSKVYEGDFAAWLSRMQARSAVEV